MGLRRIPWTPRLDFTGIGGADSGPSFGNVIFIDGHGSAYPAGIDEFFCAIREAVFIGQLVLAGPWDWISGIANIAAIPFVGCKSAWVS